MSEKTVSIKLFGITLNKREVKVNDEVIGPFDDYGGACTWLKDYGFMGVDGLPVGVLFVRRGKSFFNRMTGSSGEADVIWAEIIHLHDPGRVNISDKQELVR